MRFIGHQIREDDVPILVVAEEGRTGEVFAVRADGRPWRNRGPRTALHREVALLLTVRALEVGWPAA